MMPYERLKAWETAHQLVLAVYRETRGWPSEERFGLTAQARRAAVSVTSNLAEGSARLGGRELRRFADIGLGSLAELSNTAAHSALGPLRLWHWRLMLLWWGITFALPPNDRASVNHRTSVGRQLRCTIRSRRRISAYRRATR